MAENNNDLESYSLVDEIVEDENGIVDAVSTNFNNQNPADEILANPDEDLDNANKPAQEKITTDTLGKKGGTSSVVQSIEPKIVVDGETLEKISQHVEIKNPNDPKAKFESQRIALFESENILTTISQRYNQNGDANTIAYLKKTGKENGITKLEFCLSEKYIKNIVEKSDYENKEELLKSFGDAVDGMYHFKATSATISKDLNLDTLQFKTTDGQSYGIMFSALGMQLKFADGKTITNPLTIKGNGKDAKEGESYPFDISMSSTCFEQGKPENLKIDTIPKEIFDNMQVSALRSRSLHSRSKIQKLDVSPKTKLVSVSLGKRNEGIGYEQLDFKIENGNTYVYMQMASKNSNRNKKPAFSYIESASFVRDEKDNEFISLSLVNGKDTSVVHIPIDKVDDDNRKELVEKILPKAFEKTKQAPAARAKDEVGNEYEIAGMPVYHVNTDDTHVVSGYGVASLVRKTEQASTDTTVEPIVEPPVEEEKPEEPKEEKKEEEKNIPAETEEQPAQTTQEEQPTQTTQEEQSAQQAEKPKKSWTEFMNNLMGGDTFLGISIAVTSFSCLFPPLAILSGIMLLGFGAAKSGFIDMFKGFSFRKAKLSKNELLKEVDKQKEREMRKADRQKNKSINKEDKKYLKNVNDLIDERNRLVKLLEAEKLKVDKKVAAKNKELDKNIAKQKELYETILTKVNPEEMDIDKSLLSHELNAKLDKYNAIKAEIAEQDKARVKQEETLTKARDAASKAQENAEQKKIDLQNEFENIVKSRRDSYDNAIKDANEKIKGLKENLNDASETSKDYFLQQIKETEKIRTKAEKELYDFNNTEVPKLQKQLDEDIEKQNKIIAKAPKKFAKAAADLSNFMNLVEKGEDQYSQQIQKLKQAQEAAKEEYRKELKLEQERIKESYKKLIADKKTLNEQAKTYTDKCSEESQIGTLNEKIDNLEIDIESARKNRTSGMEAFTKLADEERAEKQKEIDAKNEEDKDLIEGYYIDTEIKKAKKKAQKAASKPSNGEHAMLSR